MFHVVKHFLPPFKRPMSQIPAVSREWHLVRRPQGWPVAEDFALREVPVAAPAPGRILVRNLHMSVDPYMRGRMKTN